VGAARDYDGIPGQLPSSERRGSRLLTGHVAGPWLMHEPRSCRAAVLDPVRGR
jgi:hypothetical protein